VQLDAYLVPLFTPISGRAIYSLGLRVRIVPIELGVTAFEGEISRPTAALFEIRYYMGASKMLIQLQKSVLQIKKNI